MNVTYIGGAYEPGAFPGHGLPEVAVMGRSNVGKSSLVNVLCNQRQLARVSKTPGRTQAIHFFSVAASPASRPICLVDLPGYGFAQAPAAIRKAWQPLVWSYLAGSPNLRLGLLLVDCRREPKEEEHQLVLRLTERAVPVCLVVTKVDKLARTRRNARVCQLASALGIPEPCAVGFSVQSRDGRDAIWSRIDEETRPDERKRTKDGS